MNYNLNECLNQVSEVAIGAAVLRKSSIPLPYLFTRQQTGSRGGDFVTKESSIEPIPERKSYIETVEFCEGKTAIYEYTLEVACP